MRLFIVLGLLILAMCWELLENIDQSSTGDKSPVIHAGDKSTISVTYTGYERSQDWKDFIQKREKLLKHIAKYPHEPEFKKDLAEIERQMQAFKRDVVQLHEEINKIPLNTERLKLAKQFFDTGDFDKARAILDAEQITSEQDALLERQQELKAKQEQIQKQLDDKANEWLLKAQLTAIDYTLGDKRIPTTCQYFEKALKSGRAPERLFQYALFLQNNNQFKTGEKIYQEALKEYRELAKANPSVYLPYVAGSLNNLGVLVKQDSSRRTEAEALYQEALKDYRELVKANPSVYLPDVATTLNNLGNLASVDSSRRTEAEALYQEALKDYRELAKANPSVYLPDVARTLGGVGRGLLHWGNPEHARVNLKEAADIIRPFAERDPGVFGGLRDAIAAYLAQAEAARKKH